MHDGARMTELRSMDVALALYSSARSELLERIRLRDQVLMAYLAAVGALFTLAFGKEGNVKTLLTLPFLALGAAVLVSQHNDLIGALSRYCGKELDRCFADHGCKVPQWDSSFAFQDLSAHAYAYRTLGAAFILMGTAVAASLIVGLDLYESTAWVAWADADLRVTLMWVLLVLSIGAIVVCGWVLRKSHGYRMGGAGANLSSASRPEHQALRQPQQDDLVQGARSGGSLSGPNAQVVP